MEVFNNQSFMMSKQGFFQAQALVKPTFMPIISGVLQRACACGQHTTGSGAECEECKKKRQGVLQRSDSIYSPLSEVPSIVREVLRSPGQPLDKDTRAYMEPRFGHDFSKVRVHTDAKAAESARALNALAYTVGRDVVFGNGQYAPYSSARRKLMAHELTHVVQQRGRTHHLDRLQLGPTDDQGERQASQVAEILNTERELPSFSAVSGVVQRHSQGAGATVGPSGSAATFSGAVCSQQDIDDIRRETLNWLDDIYEQLLSYEVDEVFTQSGATTSANQQRVGTALQQAFNTNDLPYAQVIRRRFLHMATMLRQAGRVTITCHGPLCGGAGSASTAAYVAQPYALVLCNLGTRGNRPIATFIHELGHAVLPQVGIRNTVQMGGGIRDRAYTFERIFRYLSPEETLDNAESYSLLADLLHSRVNRQVVAQPNDRTTGCTQSDPVLRAFARAAFWNRAASHTLSAYVRHLGSDPITSLDVQDRDPLMRAFPMLTTAELRNHRDAYQSLQDYGFRNPWNFGCDSSPSRCPTGRLGYARSGTATASSVSLSAISTPHAIHLCPAWFSASVNDQIRSIYALFLMVPASWVVANFRLANAYAYVDLARELALIRAPKPSTQYAIEHELQDQPTAPLPSSRPGVYSGSQRP